MDKVLIDTAIIEIKAGNGGDGLSSFLREKYNDHGGPDGGDGGNGGSVYFIVDNNTATLMDFRAKYFYNAQKGEGGKKKNMFGAKGEDMYIKVPQGTLIYKLLEGQDEALIADLTKVGEIYLVCKGGRGGKGNYRFRSSTNQAPTKFVKGTLGEHKKVKLEIKLIADIGLIGMPNAGKSTLINHLTNSHAKVANYPFTTITPNLGVWNLARSLSAQAGKTLIIADIPGLIEGASLGKGLGDEFLKHIERTKVIIHIIDPLLGFENSPDLAKNSANSYKILKKELGEYKGKYTDLTKKPEIVVINKIDVTEVNEALPEILKEFQKIGIKAYGISAVTGAGIQALSKEVMQTLKKSPPHEFKVIRLAKKYTIDNIPNRRMVFRGR